jgi:hypothetical protein
MIKISNFRRSKKLYNTIQKSHFSGGRQSHFKIRSPEIQAIENIKRPLKHYLDFRSPEKIVSHKFDHEIES